MLETMKSAIEQLKSSKLRTFLTMLGMFIGIGAVIMILSLGQGLKGFMADQFAAVGMNSISIGCNDYSSENMITAADLEAIEEMKEVKVTVPIHDNYYGGATDYKGDYKDVWLFGITENIEEVQKLNLKYGRLITEEDVSLRSKAIVVEDNFAKIMFNESNGKAALGESIELSIGGQTETYEIVGVVKSQYPVGTPSEYIMPIVYLPFSTVDQLLFYGDNRSYTAYVVVEDGYDPVDYTYAIKRILEKLHGKKDIYNVSTLAAQMDSYNKMLDTLSLFISLVAAVSLLVGGIGIMNIMLVTVRERTKEIGIRKALGATDKQVLSQFLIEALVLTVLGGIGGMLLGYVGGLLLGSLMQITAQLTAGMIVFSVGTSSIIGVIFGVYPAYKASKLDPIEALRQE